MRKQIAIVVSLLLMFAAAFVAASMTRADAAPGDPGTSPENPIVVADPSEVPEGAVEDEVSTYTTPQACDTTRSWVLTVPATDDQTHHESRYKRDVAEVEEISHQEYQIKRYVPAVEEESHNEWGTEERTRTYNPGEQEQSHQVWSYKKVVKDYKTQYHFRKFTQTKEGTKHGNVITYGPYGPWTAWEPETHTSWENSSAPLGSPEFHGEGSTGSGQNKVYWYRVWQAQFDGQTRQVESGSHFEYSGEVPNTLGSPWVLLPGYPKTIIDSEAVPASYGDWSAWASTASGLLTEPVQPANTDTHEYRTTGPVKVVDTEAKDGYWVYYTNPGESTNEADAAWILASEGLGAPWVNHAERTVVDVPHADAYTEYYVLGGEPSLNEADASWLLDEQVPAEGWTMFDEKTVTDKDGTPEIVTYYAFTDGAECDKPEGFENSDSSSVCDDGDLVTTNSTETGTPVQAEDGSWTVEVTATSSQSVKEDALKCNKVVVHHNPPAPDVPTAVDAGLAGEQPSEEGGFLMVGLVMGILLVLGSAAGGALIVARRNREQ